MSFAIKRALLIVSIAAAAFLVAFGLGKMKPPPESVPVGNVEMLIDVMRPEIGNYDFSIESQGTVRPLTETLLSAEVSGAVVSISPKFIAGGVFKAGEELMRIDQTNYIGDKAQATALVKQRQIEYDGASTLRTQGYRAEAEFASAEAALATAQANLTRATRDLERTTIRLPYDGMVRSRAANLGQYVNPGLQLGVVFATDYAEVRLPLTDRDLAFIELPAATEITQSGESAKGPTVKLAATQRGKAVSWTARIVRSEGVVDERARVTYAVARINDPYRLNSDGAGPTPMPMGTFVSASIAGAGVENAARLPRSLIRRNNEIVFVDENNTLRIEPVEVLHSDAKFAYLSASSVGDKRVSTTAIETPINGMKVRTTDDSSAAAESQPLAVDGDGEE